MSTLTWIIEKERVCEREIKTKGTNFDERKTSESETECYRLQSENERQLKKFNCSEEKHIQRFLQNSCN